MCINQHACPKVTVQGLTPIIIRKAVAQGGTFVGHQPGGRFGGFHAQGSQVPPVLSPASWSTSFRQPCCPW